MLDQTLIIASLVFGYALGSVPFGLVLTRLAGLSDIRDSGSGNIGATNVLRTGRKDLAIATLLLDGGKGAAAVLLAGRYGLEASLIAGFAAFIGHLFPLWLKFRGGKGVATFLGVLIAVSWPVGLATSLTWMAVLLAFRFSALAGIASVFLAPLWAFFMASTPVLVLAAAMAILVIMKHRENIQRLLAGDEPRLGDKK